MAHGTRRYAVYVSLALLIVGLTIAIVLGLSPKAREARHLQRGDRYFSRAQYREAILEYQNVLQVDATNARAIRQLGLAHYRLGELGQAIRYLPKAQELEPDDVGVRLKLAMVYLLTRQPAKVREQAVFALEREPTNLEALGLLAAAA